MKLPKNTIRNGSIGVAFLSLFTLMFIATTYGEGFALSVLFVAYMGMALDADENGL